MSTTPRAQGANPRHARRMTSRPSAVPVVENPPKNPYAEQLKAWEDELSRKEAEWIHDDWVREKITQTYEKRAKEAAAQKALEEMEATRKRKDEILMVLATITILLIIQFFYPGLWLIFLFLVLALVVLKCGDGHCIDAASAAGKFLKDVWTGVGTMLQLLRGMIEE